MAVGLEPQSIARSELGEGASVRPGQQFLAGSVGGGVAMSTLLGARDRTISIILPRRMRYLELKELAQRGRPL